MDNNLDQAWTQELMWVKRNKHGVIVGISKNLPEGVEFVPTLTRNEKKDPQRILNKKKTTVIVDQYSRFRKR